MSEKIVSLTGGRLPDADLKGPVELLEQYVGMARRGEINCVFIAASCPTGQTRWAFDIGTTNGPELAGAVALGSWSYFARHGQRDMQMDDANKGA